MKRLIVNADDFGASAGVNRGILHAHLHGIVTSTTVMINLPDAAPGLEQALATAPEMGIGLHFNLTAGPPTAPPDQVPSLLDERGLFHPVTEWPACLAGWHEDDVRREMLAQWDRFVALAGRIPDHLDAHHHATYLHPIALRTMLDLAREHHIPLRNAQAEGGTESALRVLQGMMSSLSDDDGRALIGQLEAIVAEGPAPFWPARLEMSFTHHATGLGDLLVILTTLPDGNLTELLTHAGYVDDGIPYSRLLDRREVELGWLTHPATVECVKAEGIQLMTFGEVTHG